VRWLRIGRVCEVCKRRISLRERAIHGFRDADVFSAEGSKTLSSRKFLMHESCALKRHS
jgi:hypothetical protein